MNRMSNIFIALAYAYFGARGRLFG